MDKYHGVGGSYRVNPSTGAREQTESPTKPHREGGARDKDGVLLNQPPKDQKPEPAFAAPAARAEAPAAEPAPADAAAETSGKSTRKGA